MKKKTVFFALLVLLGIVLAQESFVSVPEDSNICIKRFNKVIAVYTEPGLGFKIPFVDSDIKILKNAQVYNLNPSDVLTMDKKAMTVSSYCVWQIEDPLKYLQTVGNVNEAVRRIDATVYNSVKNIISSMDQMNIISARGKTLDSQIALHVKEQMKYYGLNILDVRIKQFDLPQDNKQAVYNRMISERTQMAAQYTAEGKEEAEMIRNTADKEKTILISEAKTKAEELKAQGEKEYMKILAATYSGEDRASFYEFIRSLDALKKSMKGDKTIILPLDSPLTKALITK